MRCLREVSKLDARIEVCLRVVEMNLHPLNSGMHRSSKRRRSSGESKLVGLRVSIVIFVRIYEEVYMFIQIVAVVSILHRVNILDEYTL